MISWDILLVKIWKKYNYISDNKMETRHLDIYGRNQFNELVNGFGGVNYPENTVYISISNYDRKEHLFDDTDTRVTKLNLDFDDIDAMVFLDEADFEQSWETFKEAYAKGDYKLRCTNDEIFKFSKTGKAFSWMDAYNAVIFINNYANSNFIIHCEAGMSRSQTIGRYIEDVYYNTHWMHRAGTVKFINYYMLIMMKRMYTFLVDNNFMVDKNKR